MVKQFIKRIIILNIIFAFIMTIYRIIFTFYYSSWSELSQYFGDLIQAFILGIRYDCAVLAYINSPITLLFAIFWFIGNQKLFMKFVKSLKYYYTIFLGLIITLFCVDFIFYYYFRFHVNSLIFDLYKHEISYLWYISKNEHVLFLLLLLVILFVCFFVFLVSKSILENNIKDLKKISIIRKILICCVIIFFYSFIVSGDIYNVDKCIADENKNNFSNFVINVMMHPVFEMYNVVYEYKQQVNFIKIFGYEYKIEQAFCDYLDTDIFVVPKKKPELSLFKTTKYSEEIEELKPNVVLIVVESLGMNLMQYNNSEFNVLGELKKHFDEDIVFYNCLYSYKQTDRSIEQITTTIFGMPDYINPRWSFVTSFLDHSYGIYIYSKNEYKLIGENLNNDCGEMMVFDDNNDDFLYDENIFEDIFKVLNKDDDKKKFIFALTKTNHEPFILPQGYNIIKYKMPNDISEYAVRRINTYQYSCQKLGEFLTKLKNSKYANNTIVAITGDHCLRGLDIKNRLTLNSVPLYLYIPEKLKPKKELIDTSRVVSHIDIMPTLYELSLSNAKYYSLGRSVFDKNYQNAISANYDDAIIVNGNDMCIYDIALNKIKSYKLIRERNKLAKYNGIEVNKKHEKMITQYKAAMAISQYMIYKSVSGSIKNRKDK